MRFRAVRIDVRDLFASATCRGDLPQCALATEGDVVIRSPEPAREEIDVTGERGDKSVGQRHCLERAACRDDT